MSNSIRIWDLTRTEKGENNILGDTPKDDNGKRPYSNASSSSTIKVRLGRLISL